MRRILIFTASVFIAASALAANSEIYRWKDANGTWHYSDQPQPGAELVRRGNRPATNSSAAAPGAPESATPTQAPTTTSDPLQVSDAVAAEVRAAAAATKTDQCKKADETYNKAIQNRRILKTDGTAMTSAEIDTYRLQARSVRDEICGPGA